MDIICVDDAQKRIALGVSVAVSGERLPVISGVITKYGHVGLSLPVHLMDSKNDKVSSKDMSGRVCHTRSAHAVILLYPAHLPNSL